MKKRSSDDGAVLVELALVIPILILLVVAVIEFGRVYNAQITVQAAAREGARALALGNDPGAAVLASRGGTNATVVSRTACPANASSTSTDYATVTVRATLNDVIGFIPIPDSVSASASMRCGL